MSLRKVLVTVLGHVDHGKTSLLDKVRRSAVASAEAGAITQAIGVSSIPLSTVKKICGSLLDVFKDGLTVPGLLTIDTPGHAAFTSLRKRGGSLADIAVLVVDINEGFKPQTIESIEILKANKVPFIIAANKIDLLAKWNYDSSKFFLQNLEAMDYEAQGHFEGKLYELVGQFNELGLQAERFDRVQDYTKQLAVVPISAHTGQGIPELLMVLTGLAQKFLENNLHINLEGDAKGSILEVKEVKGLGTTLDVVLYDGTLKVNDTLLIATLEGKAIQTKIRALLEPAELSEMRDSKSKFKHVKEVKAAMGVKISAPGLDGALSGMPIRAATKPSADHLNDLSTQLSEEVGDVLLDEEDASRGVLLKADTIGSLEALKNLLAEKEIPVASASLGDVSKRDLSTLESLKEKDEFTGVLLGFNIKVPTELEQIIKNKDLTIINHDIIYQVLDDFERYQKSLHEKIEKRELSSLTRPAKIAVLEGYVFRQSNPAIIGVEVELGQIKVNDPLMTAQGQQITRVKSMKERQDNLSIATQGKQFALAMDGVTIGRQVNEGDFLYTSIPEEDFVQLKKLKKHLTAREIELLKEIAQLKRKENPVWGIS